MLHAPMTSRSERCAPGPAAALPQHGDSAESDSGAEGAVSSDPCDSSELLLGSGALGAGGGGWQPRQPNLALVSVNWGWWGRSQNRAAFDPRALLGGGHRTAGRVTRSVDQQGVLCVCPTASTQLRVPGSSP